jgi:dTMP kinase
LDRFEREAAEFHERVRAAYLERAARYPARIRVIDSTQPISDVGKTLEQFVRSL